MVVYNFAAGPATLPKEVIAQIQRELPSLNGSGMSILEVSHRGHDFDRIMAEAQADVRALMAVPDEYAVLFMQGGGSGQFAAMPLNLAGKRRRIAVLDSGQWAARAAEEAPRLGITADVLASTKAQGYTDLPQLQAPLTPDYDYLHVCMNNTIEGTAYEQAPGANGVPIVADMSSNIMAQEYDVRDFGAIFAGAQKNLGPAGVTVVIVRRDLIHTAPGLPSVFDFDLMDRKQSMYNTPPVFAIYALGLVLKWLRQAGGVAEMQRRNQAKAARLYDFLDASRMFRNPVAPAARSLTNVPFVTGNPQLDDAVIAAATDAGLMNLRGHRSVGGMRASLYNAMPMAGVDALVDFLHDFEQHN